MLSNAPRHATKSRSSRESGMTGQRPDPRAQARLAALRGETESAGVADEDRWGQERPPLRIARPDLLARDLRRHLERRALGEATVEGGIELLRQLPSHRILMGDDGLA